MQFKDSRTPIQDIFGALKVDALVEGTVALVQTAEGPARVRVNARLVRAGSDTPIFFQTLERSVGDSLVLEADLARQIANAIHATISDGESRRLTQARSTDPAAEEAYFQGRYRLGQYGIDYARRALEAFTRAVTIDPQHAAAWTGAARCHISLGFDGVMSQPAARASALAEINKALALNEELPEAHAVLADLKFYYDWDWAGAEREYQRAIELNPSFTYARSQYARYLAAARRLDEAVAESARARGLDPLSAEAAQTDGLIHYYRRDFTGATEALERSLDLDPGFARARYVLGRVHEAGGRIDQARQETEKAVDLAREPGVSWRLQQIRLQGIAGDTDEARKRLDELTRDLERRKLRINAEDLAYFYAAVGERERALAYLDRAVDERDPAILWIAVDPRVDTLREDARFAAMLRRIGLPQP
jgi:tetratricopeptide (TPR) repeat protein